MDKEKMKRMREENARDSVFPINDGEYWIVDGFEGRYATRELAVKSAKLLKQHNAHSSSIGQHFARLASLGKLS